MTDKQKKDLEEIVNKYLNDNEIESSPLIWVTSSQFCGNSTRGKRAEYGILDDYREPKEEDIAIISFPKEEEKDEVIRGHRMTKTECLMFEDYREHDADEINKIILPLLNIPKEGNDDTSM